MSARLEQALKLAAGGFHLFPVRHGEKFPARKGWQEIATRDPDTLREWFSSGYLNIGISTGVFGDGSEALVCLDVDHKPGKDGAKQLDALLDVEDTDLAPTRIHATANGGEHVIYRMPRERAAKSKVNWLPGIDIRSAGGLIVAPGSELNGKPYKVTLDISPAPAPVWLLERLERTTERQKKDASPAIDVDAERAARRASDYLLNKAPLAIEGQGGDATTYAVACRLKEIGVDEPSALDLMA